MSRRARSLPAVLVMLIGPLLGVATYHVAVEYEEARARARFEEVLSDRSSALEKEISVLCEILH